MEYTLKNNDLTVTFLSKGATLHSIQNAEGLEYLWQGDAAYWSGQAPVLFPIVGSIRGDKAILPNGKTASMPRHGIVRKKEFELVEQTEHQITFCIESNSELLEQYPYDFRLELTYTLCGKSIRTEYKVYNRSKEEMPFQIGGHPGFRCPLLPGEDYSDYYVEFDQLENCSSPTPVTETGLIDMEHRVETLANTKMFPLSHELFHVDATIFDQLVSRKVTLRNRKNPHTVTLDFEELPYLILWSSANDGPFVAMEPWSGLSTCSDESDCFVEKRGVVRLAPGETKTIGFTIAIDCA